MFSCLPMGLPARYLPTLLVSSAPFQYINSSVVAPARDKLVSRVWRKW